MRSKADPKTYDVLIVGAGFGGLAALRKLRDDLGYSVRVLEAAAGAGGTWYWNRYPGARCDVESLQYSCSFSAELDQEWNWSERFATQPEILAYVDHVVDRFDLAKDISFNTRVASATFDEAAARWSLTCEDGERFGARWIIMATGPLSSTHIPPFPGIDRFKGEIYHTGLWPHHAVDFSGKRVAVIGTGSSGVQCIPVIAQQASHLYVLQRTAHHMWPARNRPLAPGEQETVKARYPELRKFWRTLTSGTIYRSLPSEDMLAASDRSALEVSETERSAAFDKAWDYGGYAISRAFKDLVTNEDASRLVNAYIHKKIDEIVEDPKTADLLKPRQLFGTKRLILDSDYYATFNRPNVTLVDVRSDPIESLTATGVRTRGAEYEIDAVVFATGFDALTGALTRIDITGRDGAKLADAWRDGPQTYLGLMTRGFPNLFILGGPQSCSALTNVITANEQQVDWFCDCITAMDRAAVASIEPTDEAQADWVRHISDLAAKTIYTKGDSWYLGANIEGKPKTFLLYTGGFPQYSALCDAAASNEYGVFETSKSQAAAHRA
jgi:cyclohexanone monooxygenase